MLHPKEVSSLDITKIGNKNILIVSKTDDLLKKIQNSSRNHFGVDLITPAQIDKVNNDISDMITCKKPFVLSCVFPPPLSLFTKSHLNYVLVSCDIHPTILYDMYLSYFVIYVDTFENFKKIIYGYFPDQYIGIDFKENSIICLDSYRL